MVELIENHFQTQINNFLKHVLFRIVRLLTGYQNFRYLTINFKIIQFSFSTVIYFQVLCNKFCLMKLFYNQLGICSFKVD